MNADASALVIGGGLAGSMAALELARGGRPVTLLEKSKGPHHKVCGEFLSHESLHYLKRHGIDPIASGGVPIRSIRLVTQHFTRETDLPFEACSLTRRKLDEDLLHLASLAGVEVQRDACVEGLENRNGMWSAHLRHGRTIRSADLFLATGKHDLRGWPRPAGTHRGLVAFKMYYKLAPDQMAELGHAVELILFPGGYAGLQPVEDGAVNLCLLVDEQQLKQAGSSWTGLRRHLLQHSRHLSDRLQGATPLLAAPLAAYRIPYGHVQQTASDGMWRIGDQAAVIPSFCGDGMSIALHSGALAASFLLQGLSPGSYQAALHRQLGRRLWAATGLSRLLVNWPSATHLVRAFPALLTQVAVMTRIPAQALMTEAPRTY